MRQTVKLFAWAMRLQRHVQNVAKFDVFVCLKILILEQI